MDQQKTSTKSRNTIMKFLPKATSSVSFQSPPIYSPVRDKRSSEKTHKSNLGIGFSGPLVSMIPADSRRKIKNKSDYAIVYEPTSPRVSCMGQVKCKYQKDKHQRAEDKAPIVEKHSDKVLRITCNVEDDHEETSKMDKKIKKKLGFKKMFSSVTPSGKKKHDLGIRDINKAPLYLDKVPSLSTMKRFSSGRGKFSSVDWTKEIEAIDSDIRRNCTDEESDDEHVVIMPSSAPVMIRNSLGFDDKFIRVAGINKEPKKEINLWKRRTMPQPKPLQIE